MEEPLQLPPRHVLQVRQLRSVRPEPASSNGAQSHRSDGATQRPSRADAPCAACDGRSVQPQQRVEQGLDELVVTTRLQHRKK